MSEMKRVAIVTGANRGIGLEVCRQLAARGYAVVLGSRDLAKGETAARDLSGAVHPRQLDVTDPESIERLRAPFLFPTCRTGFTSLLQSSFNMYIMIVSELVVNGKL